MKRRAKLMFSKKRLFIPAALSFLGVCAANAQVSATCPYTLASIRGSYSVVGTYGANVALALGARTWDGNGNFTGTFILNEPTVGSTTGARTIVTGTQVGTYTVNCNGTGQIVRTVTASTGLVATQIDDFVITAATRSSQAGQPLLATAIQDATEVPSAIVAGGIFVIRVHTRIPDIIPLLGY
jgi:hypothetical protein